MSMLARIFAAIALATQLFAVVFAQATTNATCIQDTWTYNDKGQSPCLVAAYLGGSCNNGQWNIQSIVPGQYYVGPTGSQINPCECSSVTYAMTAACALCQNSTWETWTVWTQACTTVYEFIFTESINLATSIPGWAYGDFVTPGTFVPSQAQANTTALPSTGTPPSTATATHASSSSTPSSTVGATPPNSASKKTNVGAIAGGVVGGVIGLGLLLGLVLYLAARRRRAQTAPSAAFTAPSSVSQAPMYSPTLITQEYGASPQGYNPSQPKFYDPNDPTTFPSTPAQATIHTTDSGSLPHSRPAQVVSGQYNYVPEL